jgi:BirA family transcriptional regulator, biotin operon repressor / biotin---[acetyl-CoA-carboxylase] ligase
VHIGRPLQSFETIDSTSDQLWRWAEEGVSHGACVRSEEQSAGRGRQGRSWHSPAGMGLYFSVLLRPAGPLHEWNPFSLAVGSGIARAIDATFGIPVQLKWPNDLMVGGRKLGGILCETRASIPGALVTGIGLNLSAPADGWPSSLGGQATSIAEAAGGETPDALGVDELFVACLTELERSYHRFAGRRLNSFLDELRRRDALAGRRVRYQGTDGETREGRAVEIEADGSLRIEWQGQQQRLFAGEVHLLAEQD